MYVSDAHRPITVMGLRDVARAWDSARLDVGSSTGTAVGRPDGGDVLARRLKRARAID